MCVCIHVSECVHVLVVSRWSVDRSRRSVGRQLRTEAHAHRVFIYNAVALLGKFTVAHPTRLNNAFDTRAPADHVCLEYTIYASYVRRLSSLPAAAASAPHGGYINIAVIYCWRAARRVCVVRDGVFCCSRATSGRVCFI